VWHFARLSDFRNTAPSPPAGPFPSYSFCLNSSTRITPQIFVGCRQSPPEKSNLFLSYFFPPIFSVVFAFFFQERNPPAPLGDNLDRGNSLLGSPISISVFFIPPQTSPFTPRRSQILFPHVFKKINRMNPNLSSFTFPPAVFPLPHMNRMESV